MNKLRKKIIAPFKEENLSITIYTNLDETNFLDFTFDLSAGKYFPFRKASINSLYISYKSNLPPPIIKEQPKMINKRIYDLSCNEDEFNKAKPLYENALKESGYTTSTVYASSYENSDRNRYRKIILFNPPFSQNVKINIGNIFINLTKNYFPKDSKLLKIFNTSAIKLSYSGMPNMSSVIKQHDEKVLSSSQTNEKLQCNCRNPASCSLDGKSLTKNIAHKAVVSTITDSYNYYGSSEDLTFHYNNHTKAFRH